VPSEQKESFCRGKGSSVETVELENVLFCKSSPRAEWEDGLSPAPWQEKKRWTTAWKVYLRRRVLRWEGIHRGPPAASPFYPCLPGGDSCSRIFRFTKRDRVKREAFDRSHQKAGSGRGVWNYRMSLEGREIIGRVSAGEEFSGSFASEKLRRRRENLTETHCRLPKKNKRAQRG